MSTSGEKPAGPSAFAGLARQIATRDGAQPQQPQQPQQHLPARVLRTTAEDDLADGHGDIDPLQPRAGFADRLAAFAASTKPKVFVFTGKVENLRMFNEEWGTANLVDEKYVGTKLTGRLTDLVEGSEYTVTGTEKRHPKFGVSYDLVSAQPFVRLNESAMIKFIKNNFKGIGDVSAKKYVAAVLASGGQDALEELRQQLINEPWTVDFSAIDRQGEFEGDEQDKTLRAFIQRDLSTKLTGVNGNVVAALAEYLMAQVKLKSGVGINKKSTGDPISLAWSVLCENPYAPIKKVPGYGFQSADAIGRVTGIEPLAPIRLCALVAHAIEELCQGYGHVYLTLTQAKESIRKLDARVPVDLALEHALKAGTVVFDDEHDGVRIYPTHLHKAEEKLAFAIAGMCSPVESIVPAKDHGKLRERIQTVAKSLGGGFKEGLDHSQLEALFGILTSRTRLHTVTAPPGAGKTALMEVFAKLLPNKKFLFCAPTGKGAKVLNNRVQNVGSIATTIHSMLKGDPSGGFAFDADSPLTTDELVVDEGSMPGLALACATLDAVDEDTHVVVLGDIDQLGSIDPGSFLWDLMQIPQVDHHRLNCVHRNSGGILEVIDEVRNGELNPVNRDGVTFSGTLPGPAEGFQKVMGEYIMAVNRSGFEGTALIISRRQGEADTPGWNTTYANEVLRQVCNPNAQRLPGSTLCVNDRIIIRDNKTWPDKDDETREIRVVNGDTGSIVSFEKNQKDHRKAGVETVQLKLDDGRMIDYPGNAMNALELSYAITVHSAQGSEYKDVIVVMTPGQPTFVNRNMLYTALSRARKGLSVHGEDRVLRQIAATPMPVRNSGLVGRVARISADLQDQQDTASRQRADSDRTPF